MVPGGLGGERQLLHAGLRQGAASRSQNGWCPSGGRESGSYCMGLLREGEHWQQHRRDDQSFQHGDCPRPRLLL